MNEKFDSREFISDLSKAICHGRVRNSSVFISTGVSYPNGVSVTVRIDPGSSGFIVSDDGYAAIIAEGMGAASVLSRLGPGVAGRTGVTFERGCFAVAEVSKSALPTVVGLIANASARVMERVVASLEQPRVRRSREMFDKKLQAAFGNKVIFDVEYDGATGRRWEFNAGVEEDGTIVRLFELVSPTTQSVAIANMKISDASAISSPPRITAALADYDATEPALRAILSNAGGLVISANDEVSKYRLSAA